jgi:hypothetical protein
VVAYTLPYYINPAKLTSGAKYAWLWFPSHLIMGIFVFFFIPETKDRTIEEIDEMFEMNVPARKLSSYVCVGIQQAVKDGATKNQPSKLPTLKQSIKQSLDLMIYVMSNLY